LTSAYFKLLASSPVINAATPLTSLTKDFFLSARDTLPDIGGHEFGTNVKPIVSDSIAPSAPSALSFTVISHTVNLKWNASTDNVSVAGYKIYKGGKEIGISAATSYTDTVVDGATYIYKIKAYDAAGNLSSASNTVTVNIPLIPALSITSTSVSSISLTSTKIRWTTNTPSTGIVSYGTSANNLNSKINAVTLGRNQSVNITGLARRTLYYFNISATNGLTNASSKIFNFKKKYVL
jgi:fibronectin type 3 domain-containing protein